MSHIKHTSLFGLMILVALEWCPPIQAAQDPNDRGNADTLALVVASSPDATTQQYQLRLELYARIDVDTVGGMSIGFSWSNANIRLDSAVASSLATTAFDFGRYLYYKVNRDSTNAHRKFLFAGGRISSGGLLPSSARQLLATYYFTATAWATTDSVVLDTNKFSDGSRMTVTTVKLVNYVPQFSKRMAVYDVPPPTLVSPANNDTSTVDTITYVWHQVLAADRYNLQVDGDTAFGSPDISVANLTDSQWTDTAGLANGIWYWRARAIDDGSGKVGGWSSRRSLVIAQSCCVGMTGNCDGDSLDIVDLGDLTAMNDYLFGSGTPFPCMAEGDCDGSFDGIVDVADQTRLIDYLFVSFDPLPDCQ